MIRIKYFIHIVLIFGSMRARTVCWTVFGEMRFRSAFFFLVDFMRTYMCASTIAHMAPLSCTSQSVFILLIWIFCVFFSSTFKNMQRWIKYTNIQISNIFKCIVPWQRCLRRKRRKYKQAKIVLTNFPDGKWFAFNHVSFLFDNIVKLSMTFSRKRSLAFIENILSTAYFQN